MSNPAPNFRLKPCPACSAIGLNGPILESPSWKMARATSIKRGRNIYFFIGCRHAAEVANPEKMRDDPEEWAAIEEAWSDACEQLFAARTERWSDVQRANFKRALEDRTHIAGTTAAIDFPPESPAQQEPTNQP